MSVQFGKCNFDGKPVDPKKLEEVRPVLAPYGPDGEGYICKDNFGIIYRAFHTTKESRKERQPHLSPSGFVLTWDGRLDNREELIRQMISEVSCNSTDVKIVAAAFERWGTNACGKLIGDWALSIWDSRDRSLTLATDFVGSRHLYYVNDEGEITWSTILDPLVLFAGHPLKLEEEYVAGWLSSFPATHLTPYVGIHSVPPSSFVRLAQKTQKITKYWDFDPQKKICYSTDEDYEGHFRVVFSESVRRRLRSEPPVLAELSGGLDSSSIVCVADLILGQGAGETPRLDTVSYYDDSDPNWNEQPYFAKVEEKRGRTGCHINVKCQDIFSFDDKADHLAATPTSMRSMSIDAKQFAACMISHGNRVLLSGIGGDEVTGGVPTGLPELADLIVDARLGLLAQRLKTWSLSKRKPWLHLFTEVASAFLPPTVRVPLTHSQPPPWLTSDFVRRNKSVLNGYPSRLKFFGALPSFQENLSTLHSLRRQLACSALISDPLYQTTYPYLDRDFLAFVYAVPREQVIRPGQRRFLMRRALTGIVPDDVLNRRRKGFVSRPPLASPFAQSEAMKDATRQMFSSMLGITNAKNFSEALKRVNCGQESASATLIRALRLELWLRQLSRHQTLTNCEGFTSRHPLRWMPEAM